MLNSEFAEMIYAYLIKYDSLTANSELFCQISQMALNF